MCPPGNRVPADQRLLQATNLSIDESFLTGESLAVEKIAEPLAADILVSERANLAFAWSTVMSGRGTGIVVATGLQTEVGKIAETVASADTSIRSKTSSIESHRYTRVIAR